MQFKVSKRSTAEHTFDKTFSLSTNERYIL